MLTKKDALNMSFYGHNCLSFKPSRLIVYGPGFKSRTGFTFHFYLHFYTAAIIYANEKKRTNSYSGEHALQEFVLPYPLTLYKSLMHTFH